MNVGSNAASRGMAVLDRIRLIGPLANFSYPSVKPAYHAPYRKSALAAHAARHTHLRGNMFHLLWEAIIGLIVGALAKFIMPGKDPGGIIVTMLIGIAGALLAGWLGQVIGWYKEGQSAGFIASLIGALILLGIYRLFKGKAATA